MASFAVISLAVTAPLVHAMDLTDHFSLDADVLLVFQQQLYGAQALLVGPVGGLALLSSLLLVLLGRSRAGTFGAGLLAASLHAAMLLVILVSAALVGLAFDGALSGRDPVAWQTIRLYWLLGHAIASGLAILAWLILWRAGFRMRQPA